MLQWLASIPPVVFAIALGVPYLYLAAGRWRWAMLPDAGLLALYLYRPSLALFVFVVGLIIVRWVPALAGELATMFRLAEFDGWTHRAVLFALPALPIYVAHTGKTTLLHMSSAAPALRRAIGTQVVHVPVPHTSTPDAPTEPVRPDTDAVNSGTAWEAPRISTRLSDAEEIALLAAQRGRDGKYKHSANKIYDLVGGSRADVLAQVKAIRDGAPMVYRPLTEEQEQARQDLGLG